MVIAHISIRTFHGDCLWNFPIPWHLEIPVISHTPNTQCVIYLAQNWVVSGGRLGLTPLNNGQTELTIGVLVHWTSKYQIRTKHHSMVPKEQVWQNQDRKKPAHLFYRPFKMDWPLLDWFSTERAKKSTCTPSLINLEHLRYSTATLGISSGGSTWCQCKSIEEERIAVPSLHRNLDWIYFLRIPDQWQRHRKQPRHQAR